MKITKLFALALTMGCLGLASCKEDDPVVKNSAEVNVSITLPDNLADGKVLNSKFKFTNLSSGIVTETENAAELSLDPGLYDILYEAEIEKSDARHKVRAMAHSIEVKDKTNSINLIAWLQPTGNDLVIAEIFSPALSNPPATHISEMTT